MKKRFLSFALVLCIITTFVPAVFSAPAELDTASTWAHDGIQAAVDKGFVPADLQNNFTNVITRQEFCRMAVNWLEYAIGSPIDNVLASRGLSRDSSVFTDTNDPDILAAFALGITSGVGNNQFHPSGQFSREQAATMIMNTVRALGMDVSNPPPSGFADLSTASSWAHTGINFVRAHSIMSGTGNNNFSPSGLYTREQSIITFNNIKYGFDDVVFTDEEKFNYVYSSNVTIIKLPPEYSVTETADTFTVHISNANDAIRNLSAGNLFVLEPSSANPNGFAGRAINIVAEGAEVIITARMPESIDEIYDEFEFVSNMYVLPDVTDIVVAEEIEGLSGFEMTRNPTRLVSFNFNDFKFQGITINGSMVLYTPRLHANITMQHADLFVTAEAEFNFKVSASTNVNRIIPLYTIPVMPVPGVLIEIPIGIRITADGQASLEIMCDMSVSAGIIRGQPSARVIIDHNVDFNYNMTATVSLNVQAKASLLFVPIYGIGFDLGRGFTLSDALQAKCRADSSHVGKCFVVETFNVRSIESLSDYGLLGLLGILQFSLDLTKNEPKAHKYRLDGTWNVFCPHDPPQPPTTLVADVKVSNENELRQAIGQAGSKATIIGITRDIELISNFIIPSGTDITIISDGVTMHSLIATRDMDAVTLQGNAILTIEHIGITRTPGTYGRGIVNNGTFNMNSGVIQDNHADRGDNGGGVANFGVFNLNGGLICNNKVNGWSNVYMLTRSGFGGGIYNDKNSYFTMNGGTIRGNESYYEGGGIYNSGDFNMTNGSITDNKSVSAGGGGISTHDTFILHNGIISDNSATHDGGIQGSGTFIMNGGRISDNFIDDSNVISLGGALVDGVSFTGIFTMNGGTITGSIGLQGRWEYPDGTNTNRIGAVANMNNGTINGNVHLITGEPATTFYLYDGNINGSITIDSRCSFIMNDGAISDSAGVGVSIGTRSLSSNSSFIMNGGSIKGNHGGVLVGSRGSFTMNGGTIRDNITSGNGGGVDTAGTFIMKGGMIYNNIADVSGGGVNQSDGTFTFDGGWIFNNRASNGNDIQIGQSGTFNNNVYDVNNGAIGNPPPGFTSPPAPILTKVTIRAVDFDSGIYGKAPVASDKYPVNEVRPGEAVHTEIGGSKFGGNIGWISAGDWVQYTITIEQGGRYRFEAWLASDENPAGGIKVSVGNTVVGTSPASAITGWHSYRSYTVGEAALTAGKHVIRVEFPDGAVNFAALELTKISD